MTAVATSAFSDVLVPRDSSLLKYLAHSVQERMSSHSTPAAHITLRTGDLLNARTSDRRRIYLIKSGTISQEHFSPAGRRTILDILPSNEYFGDDTDPGVPSQYLASAVEQTSLISIEFEEFQRIVQQAPLYDAWRTSLMLRSRRRRGLLLQHFVSDCEGRLAMRLYDLAQAFGVSCGSETCINLKLRHEDYGAMIGTTRSRVGHFLQRFAEKNLLRKSDEGLLIVNNVALAGYIMERLGLTSVR